MSFQKARRPGHAKAGAERAVRWQGTKAVPGSILQRHASLAFPLLVFAASRGLLFAFAKAGPLFGGPLGNRTLADEFSRAYPTWAALAYDGISTSARIARDGYAGAGDVLFGFLVPWLGKGLGAVLGSIELGLMLLSLLACAFGFVGVYRLFEELCDEDTARWGLAVLAAFPWSYHLSDGSALACLLAFSTWGVLFAVQGRPILAALTLSVGALAHPAVAIFAIAVVVLPSAAAQKTWLRPRFFSALLPAGWPVLLPALLPALVVAMWFFGEPSRFGRGGDGLTAALLAQPEAVGLGWRAVVLAFSAVLGVGLLALLHTPGVRALAVVGGLHLAVVLYGWNTLPAVALAAGWPAFLGLGAMLARRQPWRAPVVAMLCAHQGLLLYCFTHFLRAS